MSDQTERWIVADMTALTHLAAETTGETFVADDAFGVLGALRDQLDRLHIDAAKRRPTVYRWPAGMPD